MRGLVLGAVADGWSTPDQLTDVLDRGAVPWSALCRRAVRDAAEGAASPPEAEAADLLRAGGLSFVLNAEVRRDGELLAVLDGYVPGTGVGWEVDSVERHSGRQLTATLVRHGLLDRAGLWIEHVTPYDLQRDPDAFVRRVLARVWERQCAGLAQPEGLVIARRS